MDHWLSDFIIRLGGYCEISIEGVCRCGVSFTFVLFQFVFHVFDCLEYFYDPIIRSGVQCEFSIECFSADMVLALLSFYASLYIKVLRLTSYLKRTDLKCIQRTKTKTSHSQFY